MPAYHFYEQVQASSMAAFETHPLWRRRGPPGDPAWARLPWHRRIASAVLLAFKSQTIMKGVSFSAEVSPSIETIQQRIAPLRQQLASHPLYSSIQSLNHLRTFMESHVFAVWDFMCLLKSLQRSLTCVDLFWVPTVHRASRRFINEIVLGEESDEYEGQPASHFEIYLDAMERAGADTSAINAVITASKKSSSNGFQLVDDALQQAPPAAQAFVRNTLRTIRQGSSGAQAAAFTFGREDAIPHMFRALVKHLNHQMGGDLEEFVWYLQRHIEIDGDDHDPLSLRMVTDLCGEDAAMWTEAAQAAEDAIRARLNLWDGILCQLNEDRDAPFHAAKGTTLDEDNC